VVKTINREFGMRCVANVDEDQLHEVGLADEDEAAGAADRMQCIEVASAAIRTNDT
jgi:hypothetical protein